MKSFPFQTQTSSASPVVECMDDVASIGSTSTADEYCLVNADPTVRRGDSDNFRVSMSEALKDLAKDNPFNAACQGNEEASDGAKTPTSSSNSDVGQDLEGISYCDMQYLGSVSVLRLRDDDEIQRNLSQCDCEELNRVSIFVPYTCRGAVRIVSQADKRVLEEHQVHIIAYCCVGAGARFAFTVSEPPQMQHRVIMLNAPSPASSLAVVNQIALAFKSEASPASQAVRPDLRPCLGLQLIVDIQEQDAKGGWNSVPQDELNFKLRHSLPKRLHLSVMQTAGRKVHISRCFGLLLRTGSQADVACVPISMGPDSDGYSVSAIWSGSEQLQASEAGELVPFRICLDLVLEAISDPLRLKYETLVRVYPPDERFSWLARTLASNLQQRKHPVSVKSYVFRHQNSALVNENSSDSEEDNEPLPSGSGQLSKEITDAQLAQEWANAISKWEREQSPPSCVSQLVRRGVPESLRPRVWLLLGRRLQVSPVTADYSDLSCKEAPDIEASISRDIARTYTACPDFAEGGAKREDLARINKAYALYDPAVGYCQGMSFLSAALLLQMPEEEAFELLVCVMYDYGVRRMFTDGFEGLQLRFYQLDALLKRHCPDIHAHFQRIGCEPHMYASQWFLTLFTSKFPLAAVNRVLDVFLSEGDSALLKLAVALLSKARPDLLGKDFESAMRYFRVSLPKTYRSVEAVEDLVTKALNLKGISDKTLGKLAKQFESEQEAGRERQRDWRADCMRLQEENDSLARELLHTQTQNHMQQDLLEDKLDVVQTELLLTKQMLTEKDEEAQKVTEDNGMLKQMVRQLTEKCDKRDGVIAEYKEIISRLSRQETQAAPAAPVASEQPDLEVELAKTKLQLVEAQCRCQELEHQANNLRAVKQSGGLSRLTRAVTNLTNRAQLPASVSEHSLSGQ